MAQVFPESSLVLLGNQATHTHMWFHFCVPPKKKKKKKQLYLVSFGQLLALVHCGPFYNQMSIPRPTEIKDHSLS